jgi:hypothetical protein
MLSTLRDFTDWLAATPLSTVIQNVSWIIPSIQTIHIVSIAIVVTATFLVSLRVLGLFDTSEPIAALSRRFLSWVWWALAVLLVSGSLLVIGEPGRSLMNPVFALKMAMVVVVSLLTLALQRPLATEAGYWDASGQRRLVAKGIAVLSLVLWSCIVFAGRWIAYIESF